jgi:hypothetical protein
VQVVVADTLFQAVGHVFPMPSVAACAGLPRRLRQLNPERPLSAEDVEIARYRGGRPDYPLGMSVGGDEQGMCREEIVGAAPFLSHVRIDVYCCRLAWFDGQA